MQKGIRLLIVMGLLLSMAAPALAAQAVPPRGPRIDHAKAYLLEQEYVTATGETRGKLAAKRAELETLLATKPDDAAAIKKVIDEISSLRASLLETTVQFRLRLAKEANVPTAFSRRLGKSRRGSFHGSRGFRPPHPRYRGPASAPEAMPGAPAGDAAVPPAPKP